MRKVNYPEALGNLQSQKSAEIGVAFGAYLRFLEEHALVDESSLPGWAARWLGDGGPDRTGTVFIYGLYEPLPLERDLILAIRGRVTEFHYAIPWANNPAIFSDDGTWLCPDVVDCGTTPLEGRYEMVGLFSGQKKLGGGLPIRKSARRDRVDEVRAIAQEIRDLVATGVLPGDIAVAFPDLPAAAIYVEEIFPDFGIPYISSRDTALIRSPLVRALLSIIAVPVHGYRREDVVTLLSSPYINRGQFPAGVIVDLCSREARIDSGAESWRRQLEALATSLETDTSERNRRHRRVMLAGIDDLQERLDKVFTDLASLGGTKTTAEHLSSYRSLLDRWGCPVILDCGDPNLTRREVRDRAAFFQLLDTMESTARIHPGRGISPAEFLSLLSLLAGSASTRSGEDQMRRAVQVVGIREVAHLAIPHVFIAGLVEGAMPRLTTRLPFATDLEARRLGTRSRADILREERYHFTTALLAAREGIYLSYSTTDGENLTMRSNFIDAVCDAVATDTWGAETFGASSLFAAAEAGKLIDQGRFDEAVAIIPLTAVHEATNRQNIEDYHRRGAWDSPYDCVLCDDHKTVAVLARRLGSDTIFSPTMFETYASCPFRFYLKYVLSLDSPISPDPDLTARERGNLIHRIAHRFYTDWTQDECGPITETNHSKALQRILTIGEEETEEISLRSTAWKVEKEFLLGSPLVGCGLLERFIENELKLSASPLIPRAFEVSFGHSAGGEVVMTDAVPIKLGEGEDETIMLQGRIDRVDVAPDGTFMVIDYKTGRSWPGLADVMAGRALQLPLYIRAVEILTGLSGVAGAYYTIRQGEIRARPIFWDADRLDHFAAYTRSRRNAVEDVRSLVDASLARTREYLRDIKCGRFPPQREVGPCPGYCDFTTICRFNELREFSAPQEEIDEAY